MGSAKLLGMIPPKELIATLLRSFSCVWANSHRFGGKINNVYNPVRVHILKDMFW